MDNEKIILTLKGLKKFQQELEHLKTIERAEIAKLLEEARGHGDLSENAEFEFAKERQAQVESRIAQLERMLQQAEILSEEEIDEDTVVPGRIISLRNLDTGQELEFELVGFGEVDSSSNKASISSPIGAAIFKKKVGDVVEVTVPAGKLKFEIVGVKPAE